MQRSLFDIQDSAPIELVEMDPALKDRDYQARAIEGALQAFDEGQPGALIRAFTGAGKTYIGSRVAEKWLNRSGRSRVFICAHERQLVNQFRDEMSEFLRIPIGLEMSTDGNMGIYTGTSPRVVVSCRATLMESADGASRLYKFHPEQFDWLLMLDEAHRWAYSLTSCRHVLEWFEKNPDSRRLALTATPERSDGISLERIAPAIALDYPMFSASGPSAIEDGWAVPFDQKFIHVEGVDFQNLKEVAGDFDKQELEQILQEREQLSAMIRPLLDLVGDRQTLIFNPGVDLAKAVARSLNAERDIAGATHGEAEWLDGSVPDHVRKLAFERHQRGDFQFLSVCGLCREGYNDPGIQCVAIFRPTKSRSLAEQMIGRGCRPLKGVVDGLSTPDERRAAIAASDKPDCMIIDLVGATGLGKCATTAHLYAIGEDDIPAEELSDRANQLLIDEGGGDIGEAVRKAKAEIAEEREQARLKREEQERLELERKKQQARIRAEVRYQVADGHQSAAAGSSFHPAGKPATEKQIALLAQLGINETASMSWSRKQASAVISKMMADKSRGKGSQAGTPSDGNRPATERQLELLKRFDMHSDGLTFDQAAERIGEINRTVLATD